MPKGIYLDATVLEPHKMAERMNEIIDDKNQYYEFFKWHEYYSFHFSGEDRYSGELCRLCAFLNNSINKTSIYEHITEWWNEDSPVWPTPYPKVMMSITTPGLNQNKAERIIGNLISFFDPSLD